MLCFAPAAVFAQQVIPTDVQILDTLTGRPKLTLPLTFSSTPSGLLTSYQVHKIVINTSGKPFRAMVDASSEEFFSAVTAAMTAASPTGDPGMIALRRWSPAIFLYLYHDGFDPDAPLNNLLSQDAGKGNASIAAGRGSDGPLQVDGLGEPLFVQDGEYTIVVTSFNEDGEGGHYLLLLDGAVIAEGELPPEVVAEVIAAIPPSGPVVKPLDELQSFAGMTGRQNLRVLTGNITSALIEGQVTRGANISSKGTAPDMFPWFRLSNAQDVGGTNKLSVPAVQFGVDWSLAPNLVAGLSLSGARMEASNPTASLKATQIALQPYMGWSAGNWRGAASVVLGQVDYESLVTVGGAASAKGDLRALLLDAAYDFALSPAATLSPFAAMRLGRINLTETGGSLAATGIGSRVTFEEFSIGAIYARDIGPGTARLTLAADHFDTNAPVNLSAGSFDQTGWSGTLGLGYEADIAAGVNLNADAKVTGLGSDSRVGEMALTLRWSF
jgi:hypothetical protein